MNSFFTKNRCYKGGRQHNYYPIYKEEKPRITDFSGSLYQYEELIKLETKKTYLHSICKWCGNVIDKQND